MFKYSYLLIFALLTSPGIGRAQVFDYNFSGINAAIPDGDSSGLVNAQSIVAAPNLTIIDLNVTLNISGTGLGGFNGDLFVTIRNTGQKPGGIVGLRDVVVVEAGDAVLVAARDRAQAVKDLALAARPASERIGAVALRPWGSFRALDRGAGFQVKHLTVAPGGALSRQWHHHRAEHWVVVSGTARITRGDETFLLEENQSTYIPIGVRHRIENPGRIPLHVIEVQSGSYLGEDDIVRFEDRYGREGTNK